MGFLDQFRRKPRLTQNTAAELLAGLIVQHAWAAASNLARRRLEHLVPLTHRSLRHPLNFSMLCYTWSTA